MLTNNKTNYTREEIVQDLINELLNNTDREDRDLFINTNPNNLYAFHSTLGKQVRNEYGLWQREWTPVINNNGVDTSPNHPDNLSMSIIEEVWARVQT